MPLHLFELGRRQFPGLVENVLGDPDLADVMEQGGGLERAQHAGVGDAQILGHGQRVGVHAAEMAVRDLVLRVDRGGKCLDGRGVRLVHLFEMPQLIVGARQRHTEHLVGDDGQG